MSRSAYGGLGSEASTRSVAPHQAIQYENTYILPAAYLHPEGGQAS